MFDRPLLLAVFGGGDAGQAEDGAGDGQVARRVGLGAGASVAGAARVEVVVIGVEATAAATIPAARRRRSHVALGSAKTELI